MKNNETHKVLDLDSDEVAWGTETECIEFAIEQANIAKFEGRDVQYIVIDTTTDDEVAVFGA